MQYADSSFLGKAELHLSLSESQMWWVLCFAHTSVQHIESRGIWQSANFGSSASAVVWQLQFL